MYSINWIVNRKLYTVTSPNMSSAYRVYMEMRRANGSARLFFAKGGKTEMIF
jgi:hypothetical protein